MVKILPEKARIQKYTRGYFTDRPIPEIQSWFKQTLRTDQLSAIGYALGYPTYQSVCKVLGLSQDPKALPNRVFHELVKELAMGNGSRQPAGVVDVGCGRGELLASFLYLDVPCWGIDPAPGAAELVPETMAWVACEGYNFINKGMYQGLRDVPRDRPIDTVIMCESIEHIRESEFAAGWTYIKDVLLKDGGLFIVVNWINYHPIRPDPSGYDHIRHVNDAFYDRLTVQAKRVVFRQGSHLVLEL